MQNATPAQIAYLEKIAKDLGVETPQAKDKKHASELIESGKAQRQVKWDAERTAKKAEEADAMEAVEPLPEGRVKVKGEVVSTKVSEGMYGTQFKMLLKDALGRKVWMTVPAKLMETHTLEELKGKTVSGVVTLKPKADEPWFAFGSRPAGFGLCA